MRQTISFACLIYKSTRYADSVWNSLRAHTPHLTDGRARFFFVANDATDEVIDHLTQMKYPFVVQKNKRLTNDELQAKGFGPPEYIRRVYQGWNAAICFSDEIMCLVSSDMMFSSGWFEALESKLTKNRVMVSRLVERRHPRHGVMRGAIEQDFGDSPVRFDHSGFHRFASAQARSGTEPGQTYGPILLHRSNAYAAGFFPEGNIGNPGEFTVKQYGDQAFFANLAKLGVEHLMALDSIVYHFKEGEMAELPEMVA